MPSLRAAWFRQAIASFPGAQGVGFEAGFLDDGFEIVGGGVVESHHADSGAALVERCGIEGAMGATYNSLGSVRYQIFANLSMFSGKKIDNGYALGQPTG